MRCERHLSRLIRVSAGYHNTYRTHLGLDNDTALRLPVRHRGRTSAPNSVDSTVPACGYEYWRGQNTVNVVRRIGLAEELKGLGADVVVTAGPDLGARVADQTNNAQIVLGLDMISGVATAQMADCIAEGGTIATYGLISAEEAMVPVRDLLYKDLRLVGYFMGRSRQKRSRGDMEKVYEEISGLIRDGVLCAKIAATYGLEEVKEAVAHQTKSGEAKPGKIVLLCDQ